MEECEATYQRIACCDGTDQYLDQRGNCGCDVLHRSEKLILYCSNSIKTRHGVVRGKGPGFDQLSLGFEINSVTVPNATKPPPLFIREYPQPECERLYVFSCRLPLSHVRRGLS